MVQNSKNNNYTQHVPTIKNKFNGTFKDYTVNTTDRHGLKHDLYVPKRLKGEISFYRILQEVKKEIPP